MENKKYEDITMSNEQNKLFAEKLMTKLDNFGNKVNAHYLCSAPARGCLQNKTVNR